MTAILGPIAPYSNVPIEAQFYAPSRFVISNVTLGLTTIVTATATMNYVVGQQVRLLIPPGYGCTQLNNSFGYVISLPAPNQVEVAIVSAGGNSYIAATSKQNPQILAIGDVNSGSINSTGITNMGTYIPASFINISPL